MPIIRGEGEEDAILQVSKLMLASARTAPKTGGVDDVLTSIVLGLEKDSIADEMDKIAGERGIEQFKRDAENVRQSTAVILIGVRGNKKYGLNCGACGYANCDEFEKAGGRAGQDFKGPTCLFKALDLGIALGSAVKTASMLNIDNRIMYRIGAAVRRMRLMPEADIIIGIPVSAKGKSVYFDRKL
jgi:uncharacterized ferredoxin-like protein